MEHTHFTSVCEYGAVLSKMCVSFMVMVFPFLFLLFVER